MSFNLESIAKTCNTGSGSPFDIAESMSQYIDSCTENYNNISNLIQELLCEEDVITSANELLEKFNLSDDAIFNADGKIIPLSNVITVVREMPEDIPEGIDTLDIQIPCYIANEDGSQTNTTISLSELLNILTQCIEVNEVFSSVLSNLANAQYFNISAQELYSQIVSDVESKLGYTSESTSALIFQLKDIIYSTQSTLTSKISKIFSLFFGKKIPEYLSDQANGATGAYLISKLTSTQDDEFADAGITGKSAFSTVFEKIVDKAGKITGAVADGFVNGLKFVVGGILPWTRWGKERIQEAVEWVDDKIIRTDDVGTNNKYNDYGFDGYSYQVTLALNKNSGWLDNLYFSKLAQDRYLVIPGIFQKRIIYTLPDSLDSSWNFQRVQILHRDTLNTNINSAKEFMNIVNNGILNNVSEDVINKAISSLQGLANEYTDYSLAKDVDIYNRVIVGRNAQRFLDLYTNMSLLSQKSRGTTGSLWWVDEGSPSWLNIYDTTNLKNKFTKRFLQDFNAVDLPSTITDNPTNLDLARMLTGKGAYNSAVARPSTVKLYRLTDIRQFNELLLSLAYDIDKYMTDNPSVPFDDAYTYVLSTRYGGLNQPANKNEYFEYLHIMCILQNFDWAKQLSDSAKCYYPYSRNSTLPAGKYHINSDDQSAATLMSLLKITAGVALTVTAVITGFKVKSKLVQSGIKLNAQINGLNWSISSNLSQGKDVTESVKKLRKLSRKAYLLSLVRAFPRNTLTTTANIIASAGGMVTTTATKVVDGITGDKYSNKDIIKLIKS